MELIFYTVTCCFSAFFLGIAVGYPFVVARRARKAFERALRDD